jgi:hypothetical protein
MKYAALLWSPAPLDVFVHHGVIIDLNLEATH